MQYFKTVQLYFKSIINSFDILALSDHCLFEEQHSLLKTATDGAYNYHAASSCDNSCTVVVKGHMEGLHCFGDTELTILLPLSKTLILTGLPALNITVT